MAPPIRDGMVIFDLDGTLTVPVLDFDVNLVFLKAGLPEQGNSDIARGLHVAHGLLVYGAAVLAFASPQPDLAAAVAALSPQAAAGHGVREPASARAVVSRTAAISARALSSALW